MSNDSTVVPGKPVIIDPEEDREVSAAEMALMVSRAFQRDINLRLTPVPSDDDRTVANRHIVDPAITDANVDNCTVETKTVESESVGTSADSENYMQAEDLRRLATRRKPVYLVTARRKLTWRGFRFVSDFLPILLPAGKITQEEKAYLLKRMTAEPCHYVGTMEELIDRDIAFPGADTEEDVLSLYEFACDVTHYKTVDIKQFSEKYSQIIPHPELVLVNLLTNLCAHGTFVFCNIKVVTSYRKKPLGVNPSAKCVYATPSAFLDKVMQYQRRSLMTLNGIVEPVDRNVMATRLVKLLLKRITGSDNDLIEPIIQD